MEPDRKCRDSSAISSNLIILGSIGKKMQMLLYQSDKIIFNGRYVLKRLAVGLVYPLIIGLAASAANEFTVRDYFLICLGLMMPFLFFLLPYVIYRCRYTLAEISINEETDEVYIVYYRFAQRREVKVPKHDFIVLFERDQGTIWEFYVLRFSVSGKSLFTQYQEGDWDKATFIQLVRGLKQHEIVCKHDYVMKKILE